MHPATFETMANLKLINKVWRGEEKLCSSCKEWKHRSLYPPRPDRPTQIKPYCWDCVRSKDRGYKIKPEVYRKIGKE